MTQLNETYRKCIEACQECILRCEECIKGMATEASDNDCPRMLPRVFAALSALHQCNSERQSKRQGYLRTLRSGVRMVRGAVWRSQP